MTVADSTVVVRRAVVRCLGTPKLTGLSIVCYNSAADTGPIGREVAAMRLDGKALVVGHTAR